MAERVTPPATSYGRACDSLREVRYRAARTFQNYAVLPHKLDRLVGRHIALGMRPADPYDSLLRNLPSLISRAPFCVG